MKRRRYSDASIGCSRADSVLRALIKASGALSVAWVLVLAQLPVNAQQIQVEPGDTIEVNAPGMRAELVVVEPPGWKITKLTINRRKVGERLDLARLIDTSEMEAQVAAFEAEKTKLLAALDATVAALRTVQDEVERLIAERINLSRLLKQQADAFHASLPAHVKATLHDLVKQVSELEDYARGTRVREDGTPILKPTGDIFVLLDQKREQLRVMRERIIEPLKRRHGVTNLQKSQGGLNARLEAAFAEAHRHFKEMGRLNDALVALEMRAEPVRARLDRAQLLNDMRDPVELPLVKTVRLIAGGHPKYEASLETDPEILANFEQAIASIKSAREHARKQQAAAKRVLEDSDKARMNIRAEFLSLANETNRLGAEVADLILTNRWHHAGLEVAEVLLAFKDGGIVGMTAEFATKVVAYALQDGQLFQQFDESELRKNLYGEEDQFDPIQNAAKSIGWELKKDSYMSPVKGLTLSYLQSKGPYFGERGSRLTDIALVREFGKAERLRKKVKELDRVIPELRARLTGADNPMSGLREMTKRMQERMEAAAQTMGHDQDRYRQALKTFRETGVRPDDFIESGRKYRESLRQFSAAKKRYVEHNSLLADRTQLLSGRTSELNKAKDRLKQLRKIKIKDIAKSVGGDMLVSTLKESWKAHLNWQEQEAWTAYFEKELAMKAAAEVYRLARENYWHNYDVHKRYDTLYPQFDEAEVFLQKKRKEYLNGLGDNGAGLVDRTRESFLKNDLPVTIEILLEGAPVEVGLNLRSNGGGEYRDKTSGTAGATHGDAVYRFQITRRQMVGLARGDLEMALELR